MTMPETKPSISTIVLNFVFLSGVHQLDLENISNISLCALNGSGSAQIFLSPMINIIWLNSSNILISGLRIFLSGSNDNVSLFSALVFTYLQPAIFQS